VHPRPLLLAGILGVTLIVAACGGSAQSKPPDVLVGLPATATPSVIAASPTVLAVTASPVAEPTAPPRAPRVVSLAWLDGAPSPPPLPSPFAGPAPDGGLRAAIDGALAGREGSYSVVVHNLSNGRFAEVNADHVYYAASTYKLEVLIEAYRQRDAGVLDFSSVLTLEKKYIELDLNTIESLDIFENDQVSIEDAVRAMTIISDTPTASLLQDTVNPVSVDQTLASLGLTSTENANRDLPTTARDMARLLTAVAAGEGGVSEESRVEMLSLLLQETFRSGVVAGVPGGTPVAHKTGSYSGATHDVALVWGPHGAYVIAVLTDRSYDWTPIRDVSRAVWDYFAANP
jgi:beta-lactamase class A